MTRATRATLTLVGGMLAVSTGGMALGAQQEHRQHPAPAARPAAPVAPAASNGPRVGYAAEPAPPRPEPVRTRIIVVPQVIYYPAPDPYAVYDAPYEVLYDGTMVVNHGGGYQRLLRSCAVMQTTPARDVYGRDVFGNLPDPPGIAALRAGARGTMTGPVPAREAVVCYRADSYGRVELGVPTR